MYWVLQKLDKKNFLGFQIWELSVRSLARAYGWFFIIKIAFPHPLKTIGALVKYRKFFQHLNPSIGENPISNINSNYFIERAIASRETTLVAMGYCQRPLKLPDQPQQCPSARFSHDCWYRDTNNIHAACLICDIKTIIDSVIKIGCDFNIMTSALDIAKDIFMPALTTRRYQQAIFFLCPYSVRPIVLPLLICGIDFILIPYAHGDCKSYDDFSKADIGIKDKRTFTKNNHFELVKQMLDKI